ncbi:MAG: hypothetical protein KKA73_20900, partial [Chloroflexi bacterium]|nr:hypothetical protein [Chloroflexota bacterium]
MTITDARREQLREWGRRGGRARAAQTNMAALGALGGPATYAKYGAKHMARIGQQGAAVTIERHGLDLMLEKARQKRLAHPSVHERAIIAILDDLGIEYAREAQPFPDEAITVDFCFWPSQRRCPQRIIEVNGQVHYDPPFTSPARREREARRLARLREAGWQVLVI